MSKYIDAEKLIAEIDNKWRELADKNVKVGGGKYDIEISTYLSIKNLITSLRQDKLKAYFEGDGVITNALGTDGYDVAAFRYDDSHVFTILLPHDEKAKHGDKVKLSVIKEG